MWSRPCPERADPAAPAPRLPVHGYARRGQDHGVAHSWPSRSTARAMATAASPPRPAAYCQACADIDSGRFVDYTELDAASNRGVDEVQSLLEQAGYKPVQGASKVFMIDEVRMLTNTAFNAMLKTLEEPPEYLKFVLATTDPQKVPVTVLSRCLQFNLRPMAPRRCWITSPRVLANENVPAEPQALRALTRAARLHARCALAHRPGHCLWQRPVAGSGRAPDAGRGGSLLRVPPHRRAGPGRWQNRGGNGRCPAHERPVGRIDAGRNECRVAAHGRVPGRAANGAGRGC